MAGGDVGMATDGRGRVGKWGAGGLQRRKPPRRGGRGGGDSVGWVRWAEGSGSLVGPLEEGPQLRLLQRAGVVHPPPLEALL